MSDAEDLESLRSAIDGVDDSIVDLLARRAELVRRVADAKRTGGLSTVDPEREKRVLERLLARGAGRFPRDAIVAVFREIMSASVSLQAPVTVAFLGPVGTWSHLAARTFFGYAPSYLEEVSIEGVVDAVRKGRASFGVVPIENSSEGSITSALDALLEGGCQIRRELVLAIEHCLLGRVASLSEIERVYSKPEALAQCRRWLHSNLPEAQLVHTASTSAAVREAELDARGAAIGSPLAAELVGLPVIRERVQDSRHNATRFVMIGLEDARPTGNDKTSVAFSIPDDDQRGSLRRTLSAFDAQGVNLTRIESRPSREEAWRYVFVVDLEGHRADANVAKALTELDALTVNMRILGSYPRYPNPAKLKKQ